MSETHAPDDAGLRYPRALLGVYVRTSLWFVGLVAILWLLGFEAINAHPTPFYALLAPIGGGLREYAWAVGCGLIAAAMLVILTRAIAPRLMPRLDAKPGIDALRELSAKQLALLVGFAGLFAAVVAMMRNGPDGISQAYARQSYEYIGDIGTGGSIRGLFRDYEKYHQFLSMHAKVHPPGPIAILWILSVFSGRSPMGLSIATIIFGSLSVVPMYWFARAALGARAGVIATMIYTLIPSIVIFTATSADITFMPFTLATLAFFWWAIHGFGSGYTIYAPGRVIQIWRMTGSPSVGFLCSLIAGAFYGLLGLISFSLVGLGAFFGLVGLWRFFDARYRWPVIRTAIVMAIAAVGVHYLVYLWSGYNTLTTFQTARAQFNTDQANLDLLDPRWPSWAFKIVNPMCWFFFAGIPVSVLALRRIQSSFARGRGLFIVIGLTLLAFDILYLARGEGERSAMYIMPFLALPAAHMLDEICVAARSWRPLTLTLAFLGVQCIAIEAILYTYW